MAAPSYDEIVGSEHVPSYEEITGGSGGLTADQTSALSGIDMTPFHTDQSQSDAALTQQFQEKNNIPTAWEAAKSPMPYVGPAIVNAAAKAAPTLLRLGDVSGLSGIYRGLYGDQAADQVSSGIGRGVGNIAAGFTSPLGVGALALGGAPSIVQKAASGLFAADMARNLPQNFQAIGDAQTPGDRAQAITEALGTGAMLFGAGSHAFGRPGLVSPDDIAARSLLNRQSAPVAPPATPDISAPSAGAEPRSLFPSSVETAATPAQPPSTTEPSVAPESAGTSNVGAPIEKNISDMLMMSGGDHEAAATMAEKYGMPDVANQIRARAPLPSAVEPMPLLRHGPVPIAGDEGTLAEGAPAPAQPQIVDSVLSQFHMEQDPIKKQQLWQQAKGMMESGLPMGPGAMNSAEMPAPDTTSLKRAVVDTERENRGEPEIPTAPVVDDQQAVDNAKSMLDKDPTAGQSVVARINGGDPRISKQDAGLLLAERNRIVQQRTQWEERAAQSTDPMERATAEHQLQAIEEQLTAVDNASRTAGSEWSGVGHMYQRNIAEDYSLPALERKARAAKAIATGDGSLSTDELSTVQQQASDYQKLQTEAAEKQQALESAQKEQQAQADTIRAHEQTIKEMQQAEAARPKFGKAVFDQAQKIVDRLKVNADASRIKLRQALSQMNALVDPTVIVHAANILAHKVGELGLKKAEALAQMVDEFGDKITPHLEKAWKAAKKLIGAESAPDEVKKAVKSGVAKGKEKTPEDAAARLKADATAGDPLSHKAVYDVWRSKVKAGMTDVDEAAKATHETVQQSYPEATEQQVREAFSEYGKVKFPSKEADKVTLAEHRRITQLQLSIDRLKQGLDPLHTGLQRDKATQAIREKQAELNELLKQRTGPPSPEALAGRNEARKTALRNSIADLDKQLQTGEKPIDTSTPLPYDPEVERLTAERNAMKDKLNEIEAEANPPPTEAETYNKNRMAQIERESKKAQTRIDAGEYGPPAPKPPKELFDATQESLAKLSALRLKIKAGQQAWQKNNRTGPQKFWDRFVGIQRAMKLTSDVVLAKLSLAALAREALTPAEEGVGSFYSKAFPLLAERAPREGGFSLKAEAIAKAAMFTDGMKDAWQNLKFKESQLSLVHDSKLKAAPEWWDYMGFLHSALKAPVKRAEFARSLAKRTEWAMNEGRDTNDPKVMKELAQEAYVDGQRAIFMQDNPISDFINHSLAMMKNSKRWPNAGAGLSRLGHFLLPIVKVPTNLVGEVATGIHGVPTGLARTAKAYLDGIGNLKPQEADAIMRQLKKGSIGGAFLLSGYLASKSIGGFYHANDHRNQDDVQPDHYRIGGIDLPSGFSHSTAAMLLNIGATVARVENETAHGQKKGMSTGALVASQGLIRKLPFVPAATNAVDAVHDEGGFRKYIHSMLLSSTVPALIQHLAKVEDTPGEFPSNILTPENRRTPTTATEAIESGIPLLRRNVPYARGYRPPPPGMFLRSNAPTANTNRLFQTNP